MFWEERERLKNEKGESLGRRWGYAGFFKTFLGCLLGLILLVFFFLLPEFQLILCCFWVLGGRRSEIWEKWNNGGGGCVLFAFLNFVSGCVFLPIFYRVWSCNDVIIMPWFIIYLELIILAFGWWEFNYGCQLLVWNK